MKRKSRETKIGTIASRKSILELESLNFAANFVITSWQVDFDNVLKMVDSIINIFVTALSIIFSVFLAFFALPQYKASSWTFLPIIVILAICTLILVGVRTAIVDLFNKRLIKAYTRLILKGKEIFTTNSNEAGIIDEIEHIMRGE